MYGSIVEGDMILSMASLVPRPHLNKLIDKILYMIHTCPTSSGIIL